METAKVQYNGKIIDFIIGVSDDEIETNYLDDELEDTLLFNEEEVESLQKESIGVIDEQSN